MIDDDLPFTFEDLAGIDDPRGSFRRFGLAIALVEGGDVSGDDARSLLSGLLELHAIPGDEFPWDPAAGDAFNSREAELERRIGRSAAGWLSAGRPRRESFRVGLRAVPCTSLPLLLIHMP